jgi:hypothetical protein
MQSRKLRKLLNDTKYAVHFRDGKVCIGSPYVSELITVHAETMQIKYALDTFHEGRKSIHSKKLEFIWDKLLEFIESGELKTIIENNDSTEGMFPVYSCKEGKIRQQFADVFGWPNPTHDGEMMYDGTFFKTETEAIEYGIKDLTGWCMHFKEHVAKLEGEIVEEKSRLEKWTDRLEALKEKRI